MSTEILPVETVQPDPVEAPKPKRRGWIIALIVIASIIVLGIVAFFVAEALAKDYARGYVRDRIVEVLIQPAPGGHPGVLCRRGYALLLSKRLSILPAREQGVMVIDTSAVLAIPSRRNRRIQSIERVSCRATRGRRAARRNRPL